MEGLIHTATCEYVDYWRFFMRYPDIWEYMIKNGMLSTKNQYEFWLAFFGKNRWYVWSSVCKCCLNKKKTNVAYITGGLCSNCFFLWNQHGHPIKVKAWITLKNSFGDVPKVLSEPPKKRSKREK